MHLRPCRSARPALVLAVLLTLVALVPVAVRAADAAATTTPAPALTAPGPAISEAPAAQESAEAPSKASASLGAIFGFPCSKSTVCPDGTVLYCDGTTFCFGGDGTCFVRCDGVTQWCPGHVGQKSCTL
jgi:hypothetical protein